MGQLYPGGNNMTCLKIFFNNFWAVPGNVVGYNMMGDWNDKNNFFG